MHNTLIAWGADFKTSTRTDAPASLADVTPTVLSILGLGDGSCEAGCGRVLGEALKSASNSQRTNVSSRVVHTSAGSYRASVQLSRVAGHDYVDSGSRDK